ncbi:chymotrypsin-2-like [Venturia canescens]|uniref:chymotrypsin-2-like n=1 Tax=Venturia canescens TaxID=32260 RepID=UPI001C9D1F3B|nr:chymotrypsin-2-like [Venturia canescens]
MSGLKRAFALLTLAAVVNFGDARSAQKIIGGSMAAPGEFPYQVSLRWKGQHLCGGSIIDERHIVTAAHCIIPEVKEPFTDFDIMTGTNSNSGGQIHAVKAVFPHAEYNPSIEHDIAVVELVEDIKFDDHQNKINLPSNATKSGVAVVATGWGLTNLQNPKPSKGLMKVSLFTLDSRECQLFASRFKISAHQICTFSAPGQGVCMGDSGGPLALGNVLIGVVSYGLPCARGYPDVYTNVYSHVDWIKEKAGMS